MALNYHVDEEPPRLSVIEPQAVSNGDVVSIAAAVEIFFGDLRLAPRSRKTYRNGIAKFVRHLEQNEGIDSEVAPVTAIAAEHITSFASLIIPPDIRSPEEVSQMRTAQNNLSAVRKFCAYISAYDYHPTLSTDRIRVRISAMMPRFTPPPPDVKLTDLERIVEFVRQPERDENPVKQLRALKIRAIIFTLFRTGVRVSELCAFRRRDIELVDGKAHVYRAKGGKSRTVHFDAETAQALQAYWTLRGDLVRGAGSAPAFSGRDKVGEPGNAISPRTVEHIISQLCTRLGIESEITPHSFRHGLATEMVRRRVRESTVQTILGHASPQTTRIYIHQSAVELADEYQDAFGQYRPPGEG